MYYSHGKKQYRVEDPPSDSKKTAASKLSSLSIISEEKELEECIPSSVFYNGYSNTSKKNLDLEIWTPFLQNEDQLIQAGKHATTATRSLNINGMISKTTGEGKLTISVTNIDVDDIM